VASLRAVDVQPASNKADGKKGGVSGYPGKKQTDLLSAAAEVNQKREKKLPMSSGNTRQSTPTNQLLDLHGTDLDTVHSHLPADGMPLEDSLVLEDYNDVDFPPKYNYQSVECLPFYISKKN